MLIARKVMTSSSLWFRSSPSVLSVPLTEASTVLYAVESDVQREEFLCLL